MYWEAINADPLNTVNWYYLGIFYDRQKQDDSAAIFYEKAITIDSNYLYGLRNLGDVYAALHQNEKAKEIYWRAIKADSLNADNWNKLGNFYHNQKRYDSAAMFYKKALAIDSSFLFGLIDEDVMAAVQNINAREMYRRAIKADSLNTNNWDMLYSFFYGQTQYDSAQNYYNQKQYDSAIFHFQNVISLDSLNLNAYNLLVSCFGVKQNLDSSAYYFTKMLENKIANQRTYELGSILSNSYQENKLFDEEIKITRLLYNYDSTFHIPQVDSNQRANILDNLAYAYLNTGQPALSKYYYKKEGFLYYYYYNIACLASLDKKAKEALENLELSFQKGYKDYDHLLKDTDLDNIRGTDEFKQLLKKYFLDKVK